MITKKDVQPNPEYEVLLYYKYVHIDDPVALMNWQREICHRLGLKGRIIIAHEGINGTVEGTKEATTAYIEETMKDTRLADVWFKKSVGTGLAFPKLRIRVRDEIVETDLGKDDIDPQVTTGKYLTADELHEWFESGKEFYIVDMRNDYEQWSGHFEDSILTNLTQFRDLPKVLEQIKSLRDKTIVTVCTGGVRCEKASGFLVEHGFNDVYQLYGGIVTYMEKYPNGHFKGSLYVFDNRLVLAFNMDNPKRKIIGRCMKCGVTSENYVNCAYDFCHFHYISCEDCYSELGLPFCKEECKQIYLQSSSTLMSS